MPRASLAEASVAEDAFACIDCCFHDVLRHHEHVLVVERSRVRAKFRRAYSVVDCWLASIQRDTDLDVFPQFARYRSYFYWPFCCLHERRPKHGEIAGTRFAVPSSCCWIIDYAAGGAARRSRDALANVVDPALRRTGQSAVSSAEDWRLLSPLHWSGSCRDRGDRCRAAG